MTTTTDGLGNVTTYAYDAAGEPTSVTDPLGHTTTTVYDAAGQVTETINALGNATYYGYDAVGNQTSVTDALEPHHHDGLRCRRATWWRPSIRWATPRKTFTMV